MPRLFVLLLTCFLSFTGFSQEEYVVEVQFSPGGDVVYQFKYKDSAISVYDAANGHLQRKLEGLKQVRGFKISEDGRVVGFGDHDIITWGNKGEKLAEVTIPGNTSINDVAILPNGKLLVGAFYKFCLVNGSVIEATVETEGVKSVRSINLSKDGTIAVAVMGVKGFYVIDVASMKIMHEKEVRTGMFDMAIDPAGKVFYFAGMLWDVATATQFARFTTDAKFDVGFGIKVPEYIGLESPVFNRSSSLLFGGFYSTTAKNGYNYFVAVIDAKNGKVQKIIPAHTRSIEQVSLNRNETLIASGANDNTVAIWDIATGDLVKRFTVMGPAFKISFSPDDKKMLIGVFKKPTEVWDIEAGKLLYTID